MSKTSDWIFQSVSPRRLLNYHFRSRNSLWRPEIHTEFRAALHFGNIKPRFFFSSNRASNVCIRQIIMSSFAIRFCTDSWENCVVRGFMVLLSMTWYVQEPAWMQRREVVQNLPHMKWFILHYITRIEQKAFRLNQTLGALWMKRASDFWVWKLKSLKSTRLQRETTLN